jgi:hypothetical protein
MSDANQGLHDAIILTRPNEKQNEAKTNAKNAFSHSDEICKKSKTLSRGL